MPFARNICDTYGKFLLDTATKTGLDATKSAFKKVAHKTAEATAEVIGNKVVERIVKPKHLHLQNIKSEKFWKDSYSDDDDDDDDDDEELFLWYSWPTKGF